MCWCSGMHSWDVWITWKDTEGTRESFWWSPFCCFRQCGSKQWKMSPTGAQPAAPIVRIWQPIGVLCLTKITALWGPSSHINSFTGNCLWQQRPGPSSCSFGRVPPCLWHPGPWGQYWLQHVHICRSSSRCVGTAGALSAGPLLCQSCMEFELLSKPVWWESSPSATHLQVSALMTMASLRHK